MYTTKISGTGSYIPEKIVNNEDLSQWMETSDEWIYSRTGIRKRHIATHDNVAAMGAKAAQGALEDAKLKAKDIDLIIVATISSEYAMPSIACIIQNIIRADNAFAFDIQAACTGFLYGMEIVDKYIQSGTTKKALLIGSEKMTRLMDWKDRSTSILFGDGAGAIVLERASGKEGIKEIRNYSIGGDWEALKAYKSGVRTPWYEEKKENQVIMEGKQVFEFACRKIPEAVQKLGVNNEIIDYYVLHQANIRIINHIAKSLNVSKDKFYTNIEEYGNTSGASIPIVLDEMAKKGILAGKRIIISGFGAGLTYGVAMVEF